MKSITKLAVIATLAFSTQCMAKAAYPETQAEINQLAYDEYSKADKQLNEIYQTVINQYDGDKLFISNLRKSQRIWIQFRDAELALEYPDYKEIYGKGYYGSIHPMERANFLQELTEQRIKALQRLLDKTKEDACEVCLED